LLVPPDAPTWFSVGFLVAVVVTTAIWYALVAVAMYLGLFCSIILNTLRSLGHRF
jgi:hypothetical protein